MKIKNLLTAITVLSFFVYQQASAQFNAINTGKLQVYASVNKQAGDNLENISKATVTLYEDVEKNCNWNGVQELKTRSNGNFSLNLDYNSKYMIEVEKKGFVTKRITFDTDVFGSTIASQDFYFVVSMVEGQNPATWQMPVANVFYAVDKNKFDYELSYEKAEAGK